MKYLEWNSAVAEHFFSPSKAGRKVYLFATPELIDELGESRDAGFQNFVEAVKGGPPWATCHGFCQSALKTMQGWRQRNLTHPPYVAYLVLFVIAAGLEGPFAPNAYYPRLRTLLGEPPLTGTYPSFDRMLELWDDLERWSNVDKAGEWGVFQVRVHGEWIHRGVPVAQTLLSGDELHSLAAIFADAGLDPTAPPAEEELAHLVVKHGRNHLRQRTINLLKNTSTGDADTRQALVEQVFDEFYEWDGAAVDKSSAGNKHEYFTGGLRLCCNLDRTAGSAGMALRCKTAREFPDDGLELKIAGTNIAKTFVCDEAGGGWSSLLRERDGKILDAASLDWTVGLQLGDTAGNWRFRMAGSPVRLMGEGRTEGLAGLVEIHRLPVASKLYVLVHTSHSQPVENWGNTSCHNWAAIPIVQGLPTGWRLFVADRARSDELVRRIYPCLSLPTNVSILLHGGIRVASGNRYFQFAPPSIEVRGPGVNEVALNGQPITADADGCYKLTQDSLPINQEEKILIEAKRSGETVGRLALYLAREGWPWAGARCGLHLGSDGGCSSGELPAVQGTLVRGFEPPPFDFSRTVSLPDQGAIYYIGQLVGQIVHWPAEPLPDDWSPTWVVAAKRKGRLIFCGTDILAAEPATAVCKDRKKVKKWREFVAGHCKQLVPPAHPQLRALWQKYQNLARSV